MPAERHVELDWRDAEWPRITQFSADGSADIPVERRAGGNSAGFAADLVRPTWLRLSLLEALARRVLFEAKSALT